MTDAAPAPAPFGDGPAAPDGADLAEVTAGLVRPLIDAGTLTSADLRIDGLA